MVIFNKLHAKNKLSAKLEQRGELAFKQNDQGKLFYKDDIQPHKYRMKKKLTKQTARREVEHCKLQMSCYVKDPDIFEKVNLNVKQQTEMR